MEPVSKEDLLAAGLAGLNENERALLAAANAATENYRKAVEAVVVEGSQAAYDALTAAATEVLEASKRFAVACWGERTWL